MQLVRMPDAVLNEGWLAPNPARTPSGKVGYLPAASRSKERRYLTAAELDALAAQCRDHRAMVLLTGYTGLRWGEVTALQMRDFDMLKRRLTVRRAYSIVGSELVLGDTKNHETRVVRFPALLAEPLARLMTDKGSTDLVFCRAAGRPLDNRNFPQRVLTPAWQRAGIVRLTFHDLRHTAASLAISAGASPKAVQKMLGHASTAMTLDVYSGCSTRTRRTWGAHVGPGGSGR